MPTVTESKDPKYTYCKKFNSHCLCPKCTLREERKCPSDCKTCDGCCGVQYYCNFPEGKSLAEVLNNLQDTIPEISICIRLSEADLKEAVKTGKRLLPEI